MNTIRGSLKDSQSNTSLQGTPREIRDLFTKYTLWVREEPRLYPHIIKIKKRLAIRRISGLMMLHYFKWPWCLDDLQNYVDDIYVLLHYSPRFRADWPKSVPKVAGTMELSIGEEWQIMEWRREQGTFRENLLRALDDVKPDLVFFPDEDESFPEPEFLERDLARLYSSKKKQLAFKRCNFWNSMDTVRKDRWVYYGPHVKIFKWEPGLTYIPYLGFNKVSTYGSSTLVAGTAMKHYAYLDKEERERRYHELYKAKQGTFKGLLTKPKLVKYTNALRAPRT